jgi:predicted nucleic acid-binding protein
MNVLLDTNTVLDVLLERSPWHHDADQIWQAGDAGQITGYLTATSFTNIYYIARRVVHIARAQAAIGLCLATFAVAPVDRETLLRAAELPGNDFEDNVQIACAVIAGLDAIVTRDPKGFAGSPVLVLTPAELLARL